MILDDFVLENWQPPLVVGDSMFLGGGLKYVLLGDEVTAGNFRGDERGVGEACIRDSESSLVVLSGLLLVYGEN
jgi:hypothetical protein